MKKIFGKIVLLITAVCLMFSFTACAGDPPTPPKEYTQEEAIATAVQNTLKEKNMKVRADAEAYIAKLQKKVPLSVSVDIQNQNGKIDFAASYTATTTALGQQVTIGNSCVYKDGILYSPAYDQNGDVIPDRVSTSIVDFSLEELFTSLPQITAMLGKRGGETVKPKDGVYTFEAAVDAKPVLAGLQTIVLHYKDTQIGDMIADLVGGDYTREALIEDLTEVFDSENVAGLAQNLDVLFAHLGLPLTTKALVNEILSEMGYTKNDIYYLVASIFGSGTPKPTAEQTTYDYVMGFVGMLSPDLILEELGYSMAQIKELVIDGYVDKNDCLFGGLWDMAIGYLENMLSSAGVPIESVFLSCEDLAKYTVNTCKGSVKLVIDAKTMRICKFAFMVDTDIDYEQEKMQTYIAFDGAVTYGDAVTVTVPDKIISPCIECDKITYKMLKDGAPWGDESYMPVRVFVGSYSDTGAHVTLYDESGNECDDYELILEDGLLQIPAALLADAYENNTSYTIQVTLLYGEHNAFLLPLEINPKGSGSAGSAEQAA